MLEELKEKVLKANLDLVKYGLIIFTWGNVSAIDRAKGVVAIKPSGLDYECMSASDIVLMDLDGKVVEGELRPSSDAPTHLEIYKRFGDVGGVVHTHSTYATAFAQAGRAIIALGTTHADYFYGNIPCTRALSKEEIESEYEKNTGLVIAETVGEGELMAVPGILVKNHGVFAFGRDGGEAVHNAVVVEETAKMAHLTHILNPSVERIPQYLLDKHYNRKHGKNAYYGQAKK